MSMRECPNQRDSRSKPVFAFFASLSEIQHSQLVSRKARKGRQGTIRSLQGRRQMGDGNGVSACQLFLSRRLRLINVRDARKREVVKSSAFIGHNKHTQTN